MGDLNLNNNEYYVIGYHLNVFREAVEKGYRKKHWFKWRSKMKIYDELLKKFSTENVFGTVNVVLTNDEHLVLSQLLNWYSEELEKSYDGNNEKEIFDFKKLTEKVSI